MDPAEKVTYFAETDSRNSRVRFGIKSKDRTRHVYVIGKTGMGKSTLLENMAIQDILNGEGMAFIDPHGKTAELLLEYIPASRIQDVMYFAPFDIDHPLAFNVMEDVGPDKRHLVANGLMSAFKKLFGAESFSDRMQYILQNAILALLEYPGATLLGINRMLTDKEYRDKVVENVTDTSVKAYWTQEFASYTERFAAEATPAIQNKIGQFTSNPLIRNIIGQERSSFDVRKIMDEGKILIINLSKGKVGEQNANLLGSILITRIYLSAMSRADVDQVHLAQLPNFYLYVDEFQSFANESFADILSEARKYKLNLTIAHQYIEQMSEEVRAAVFGNVGTMISFRVGAYDADVLEKEFAPVFLAEDLVNLGFAQIYLKLMIDGISSSPFSATTLPPIKAAEEPHVTDVIEWTRRQYTTPKADVERKIREWHEPASKTSNSSGNGKKNDNKKEYSKSSQQSNNLKKERSNGQNENGKRPSYAPANHASSVTVESIKRTHPEMRHEVRGEVEKNHKSDNKPNFNQENKNQLKAALDALMKQSQSVPMKSEPAKITPTKPVPVNITNKTTKVEQHITNTHIHQHAIPQKKVVSSPTPLRTEPIKTEQAQQHEVSKATEQPIHTEKKTEPKRDNLSQSSKEQPNIGYIFNDERK